MVAALRRENLSEREIAFVMGLSPARVHSILSEMSVPPPPKSERNKKNRSPLRIGTSAEKIRKN
jgi:predicted transcriptional regulator